MKRLLILLTAMTLSSGAFAEKTAKDVNVVNTPDVNIANVPAVTVENNPDVNVVNVPYVGVISSEEEPVVTRSLDIPGRQVFAKGSFLWLRAPNNRDTGIIVTNGEIPSDKVLVIDFVSLNILSEFEQNIATVLRHKVKDERDPRVAFRDVVAPLQPSYPLDPRQESWYYGSIALNARIYLEHISDLPTGDGILLVSVDRRETVGSVNTDFYVSGHFVDKLP